MVAAAPSETLEVRSPSPAEEGGKARPAPVRDFPTLDEIRRAIPAECFEKRLGTSLFYMAVDFAALAGLYWVLPGVEARFGWPGLLVWYYVVGMFGSSLFVIGHDCGHTTFSEYTWVNDLCGHLTHSPILAPYWPWQKSHRQHHTYTGHLEKDRGHPWVTQDDFYARNWVSRNFAALPLSALIRWQPIYTMLGLPDGSHYWPFSKLFTTTEDRVKCVVSSACCLACAYGAYVLAGYSVYNWIKYYYVPLLFQGLWIIMITYLQHQDEEIEVYEQSEWHFIRGQAQTIDRTYGFGIDTLIHHISDGHVAHHLFFTKIPHYHLPRATQAIREVLRQYPGVYKQQSCYATLLEFFRLNAKLDYLLGKGTGVLKYRVSKDHQQKSR